MCGEAGAVDGRDAANGEVVDPKREADEGGGGGGGASVAFTNEGEGIEPEDEFDWPRECDRDEEANGAEGGCSGEYCCEDTDDCWWW